MEKYTGRITFPSGHFYVPNEKGVTDSLFEGTTTASGVFKPRSNGVMFFDLNKTPIFFLVCNTHNEHFFVSVGVHEGKVFYQHALCEWAEKLLGFDSMGYLGQSNFTTTLARRLGYDKRQKTKKEIRI